ncbi:MAG: alpha/beta fold hydrolase [Jatrophihabitantaceae bacterium]
MHYSTVPTADGRILEYFESGPSDSPALLFQHGTPGAAVEFAAVTEPANALGLRTICYSRPGYGQSSEQPGRRVADAVTDIVALLNHLEVQEFRTLGWSGGGPHALACAALLPGRCQAAALLAGVAPYDAHGIEFTDGMTADNVTEFAAAAAGETELSVLLNPLVRHFQQVTGDSVAASLAELASPVDQRAMTGQLADDLAASFRQAMAVGIAGWRDDDLAFVQDWGFDLKTISVPIAVWQGRQDRMVPFAHGQWLAAEIPTAQPHLFADEGHISLIGQLSEVLADLFEASPAG